MGPRVFLPALVSQSEKEVKKVTAAEYERLPEVKAALKLVRENRELLARTGSWMTFKHRLMELLGIPAADSMVWDVPVEFMYAQKRVGPKGERGWSKEDAFRQIVSKK